MSEFSASSNTSTNIPTIERVRHDLKMRDVEVVRIDRLSPGFAAITFKGEALADFISLSFDDHVKFMFDGADGQQVRRDYTPRRFDREARELTLEFALHGHGGAAEWARNASVGQRAVIGIILIGRVIGAGGDDQRMLLVELIGKGFRGLLATGNEGQQHESRDRKGEYFFHLSFLHMHFIRVLNEYLCFIRLYYAPNMRVCKGGFRAFF